MVIVNAIDVIIKNKKILQSVSCTLTSGRITLFIGKSGSGKTTLLKSLINLLPVSQGEITIDNKKLKDMSPKERSETIGYVFQDFNLFPHLTVEQNCIDPLLVHGLSHHQAKTIAHEALQELDMLTLAIAYPSELSGGQKQRVAIARALCLKPKVLLLDEPTASLDPFNADILMTILKRLTAQGLIVGISSQDMSFINKIFDRVYYIENGAVAEFCDRRETNNNCPIIQKFLGSQKEQLLPI